MHARECDNSHEHGNRRGFGRTLVLSALLAFSACSMEADDNRAEPLDFDEVSAEIVENLLLAGFPEIEIEVRDDGEVWVGDDAVVSLGASREMLDVSSRAPRGKRDAFRQYRTTNLVAPTVNVICVDGSAFTGVLSTALDSAIANYNALDLWFQMVRTSGSDVGCEAEIVAVAVAGSGGSAGFPAGGLPYGQINIGSGAAAYGAAVTTHVITHELGHCLGFRHSDYYSRAISCGAGGNEGQAGVGAINIPGTPVNAVYNGSVMNACFNLGSTGVFTATDLVALHELYDPDPSSCQESDACGDQAPGGCWCDAGCTIYGDCCLDGPCATTENSCQESGSCGVQTPGGCWCDAACTEFGDCCLDGPC